jgi:putative transposase
MNIGQKRKRQIHTLCLLLGYSRQAFYKQKNACEQKQGEQELIIGEVLRIREDQRKAGTRKLLVMLQPFFAGHGIELGRDALFTLLCAHNLLVRKRKRRVPRTTFSDPGRRPYPDLTIGLSVLRPNELWVSDITYIHLADKFAYLSLITDAYSRMIVGYHLSLNMRAESCVKALQMALRQLPEGSRLIHHSDRGQQYMSVAYTALLTEEQTATIAISTTQHSDPRENAIAERVNGIIKQELLEVSYKNFEKAQTGIIKAIDIYNNQRPHSSIDMLTPSQAHIQSGILRRRWKNYYPTKQKEIYMS